MNNYIKGFFAEYDYPAEAAEALTADYIKLENSTRFNDFEALVCDYATNATADYSAVLAVCDDIAAACGVHKYALHLLLFIRYSEHLKEFYMAKNVDLSIYRQSVFDLKYKLFECFDMHGVWGSFVAWWFGGFFDMKLFGIGRLEYELVESKLDYNANGADIKIGDKIINIHIPSSGPLNMDECEASLDMAAKFFKNEFAGRKTVFFCSSWLLYPEHFNFLPQNSNILNFMRKFDIIESAIDEAGSDMWRIFNIEYSADKIPSLPRDTGLRRAYADWLASGRFAGSGKGFIVR